MIKTVIYTEVTKRTLHSY